jgi:hypothetical protein
MGLWMTLIYFGQTAAATLVDKMVWKALGANPSRIRRTRRRVSRRLDEVRAENSSNKAQRQEGRATAPNPSSHQVQSNRFHTQLQRVLGSKVQTSTPKGSLAYQGIAIRGVKAEIEVEDV